MKLLIQGVKSADQVPGISSIDKSVEVVCADDGEALAAALPGTEVLLAWNFRDRDLRRHWDKAEDVKWIHWGGAGVDAALFDSLRDSDVTLTNAQGIFDRAMAETLLGYMLMVAKDFRVSLDNQRNKVWQHRLTRLLKHESVLIIGAGSIGRTCARLLKTLGLHCEGAARTARSGDNDFEKIHASEDLADIVPGFDWVVAILPATPATRGMFDAGFFSAMNREAHFVNLGRGDALDEQALLNALEKQDIAGAMLDVFCNEPLPESDPLWDAPNLFVSPHMSGDYREFQVDMAQLFLANLERYRAGEPLENVVDKKLGFVSNSHAAN